MAVYPTLSVTPTEINQTFEDSTLRVAFEAGFQLARSVHTRDRSTFTVTYNTLQRVDKDLLIAFLKVVRGADAFTWENHDEELSPDVYQTYQVRFSEFPEISAVGGRYGLYDLTFTLEEV